MKRRISRKNLRPVVDLLPETERKGTLGMLAEWRREALNLRIENENLRPLKTDLARLRSSLADLFFNASEKVTA